MTSVFIQSIDKYIPDRILSNSSISMADQVSCRVFVCVLLATFVLALSLTLVFLPIYFFSDVSYASTLIAGIVGVAITALLYLFFYKTGYIHAATTLFSTAIFIVIIFSIVISRGPLSTSMPILISCPVIAALISGRQEAIYNCVMVLVVGGALVVLENMGFKLYPAEAGVNYNILFYSSWTITILLNTTCLYVYQHIHEEILKKHLSIK